jgi:hypothetical protein
MRFDVIRDALNASKFRIVMSDEGKPFRVLGFYPMKLSLKGTMYNDSKLIFPPAVYDIVYCGSAK